MLSKIPGVSRDELGYREHQYVTRAGQVAPIPQPDQTPLQYFQPLPLEVRQQLAKRTQFTEKMATACPEMTPVAAALKAIVDGKPLPAQCYWQQKHNGKSMVDVQAAEKIGAITSKMPYRQRIQEMATTKRQRKVWNTDGQAYRKPAYWITQSEVPHPKAPPTRTALERTRTIAWIRDQFENEYARPVHPSDNDPLSVVNSVIQEVHKNELTKPEQDQKVRTCINLIPVNEPMRAASAKRKHKMGYKALAAIAEPFDTATGADIQSGYSNIALHPLMARQQRYLMPRKEAELVRTELGLPPLDISEVKLMTDRFGLECEIHEPTAVTFGATPSMDWFIDVYDIPLSTARAYGQRIATMVDDFISLAGHGPTQAIANSMFNLMILRFTGFQVHMEGPKASMLWPTSIPTFDGNKWSFYHTTHFSNPPTEARHRAHLRSVLQVLGGGSRPLMQDMSEIIGGQRSHARTHRLTPHLLATPQSEFTRMVTIMQKRG